MGSASRGPHNSPSYRRRRPTRWAVIVVGALIIGRDIPRLAKSAGLLGALWTVVSVAIVLLATWLGSKLVQSHQLARTRKRYTSAIYCDKVMTGGRGRILAVSSGRIALLTSSGRLLFEWPRSQLEHAVVGAVPGWGHRTCLTLKFGRHMEKQSIEMVFPVMGGLWSSNQRAVLAKREINAAAPGETVQAHR